MAGPVRTFEGLQNFEQVSAYYNGGMGSLGSGPGPNFGITFSSNGVAYIPGQQTGKVTPFPGDPSPPTVLLLFNQPFGAGQPTSMTMDVAAGFSGSLLFYDIAIGRAGSATIYSGLDGGGTVLAQQALPITPEAFGGPAIVPFSGVAQSVVFTGGNDQLALDNITFIPPIPEPSSWILMVGMVSSSLIFYARRKRMAARSSI
jgi:hypothetical protein